MIFTSVLLPAPFAPIKPCTSPGRTSSEAALSATTKSNLLATFRASRRGTASLTGNPELTWARYVVGSPGALAATRGQAKINQYGSLQDDAANVCLVASLIRLGLCRLSPARWCNAYMASPGCTRGSSDLPLGRRETSATPSLLVSHYRRHPA